MAPEEVEILLVVNFSVGSVVVIEVLPDDGVSPNVVSVDVIETPGVLFLSCTVGGSDVPVDVASVVLDMLLGEVECFPGEVSEVSLVTVIWVEAAVLTETVPSVEVCSLGDVLLEDLDVPSVCSVDGVSVADVVVVAVQLEPIGSQKKLTS